MKGDMTPQEQQGGPAGGGIPPAARASDWKAAGPSAPDGFWSRFPVIVLMVLVLAVAGLLSAVTAMRIAIQGREIEVPALTGLREPEAGALVRERGLDFVVDSRRFSPAVPEGEVLDQSPRAGSRVKTDRSVRVRISLGEREFAVPDVRGTSLRSTQLQLEQRGLALGSTLYSHTAGGDAGTVVFQEPHPGDIGGTDPSVAVLVSLGSADRYFVMPRLMGLTATEAGRHVRDAGFRVAEIPDGLQVIVPPGLVVSQQPAAGHRVARSDVVVLGVSQ